MLDQLDSLWFGWETWEKIISIECLLVNEAEIVPHTCTFEISGNIEQLQYDQRCQQHQNIINLRNKCNKLCDLHKNQKVYFIRYILLQMHCIHV